jgi:cell wall-associated NlpC family hydrolase
MPRPTRLALAAAAALIAGCATQVAPAPATDALLPLPTGLPHVSFQNPALEPTNGGRFVPAAELLPGDILLTAANGLTSIGIRLATLAPVSHAALYAGDGDVVEAVGEGVRRRSLDEVLAEESVVVAFRHPALDAQAAARVRSFALDKVGTRYSHVGVMLHAPFSLQRRLCELPLVPSGVRDFCVRGVARIQLGASSNERFFCSQLVMEAYRQAGVPITTADPRWVSPADILHMREGDVPSISVVQPLTYLGHLKYVAPAAQVTRAGPHADQR